MPTSPQHAAGSRIEPPVSEPSAPKTARAATAAPGPLDEPPGMCAGFHGLRTSPVISLWPVVPSANSTMLSWATSSAPAASSRASTLAVWSGTKSARMREPQAAGRPAR